MGVKVCIYRKVSIVIVKTSNRSLNSSEHINEKGVGHTAVGVLEFLVECHLIKLLTFVLFVAERPSQQL